MNGRDLDRHITGNWGEDFFREECDVMAHWHLVSDTDRKVAWEHQVICREAMVRFANGFPMLGMAVLGPALGFVACEGVECWWHDTVHPHGLMEVFSADGLPTVR